MSQDSFHFHVACSSVSGMGGNSCRITEETLCAKVHGSGEECWNIGRRLEAAPGHHLQQISVEGRPKFKTFSYRSRSKKQKKVVSLHCPGTLADKPSHGFTQLAVHSISVVLSFLKKHWFQFLRSEICWNFGLLTSRNKAVSYAPTVPVFHLWLQLRLRFDS